MHQMMTLEISKLRVDLSFISFLPYTKHRFISNVTDQSLDCLLLREFIFCTIAKYKPISLNLCLDR